MGSKTTSQVTNSPNPDALSAYNDVVGKAQSVANTPYQPYGGELVAGLNAGQGAAIGELNGAYGAAQGYIDQGAGYLGQGAQGLGNVQNYLQAGALSNAQSANYGSMSASALGNMAPYMELSQGMYGQGAGLATPQTFDGAAVAQYMSPYLSNVVGATSANLQENDAQQRQAMTASDIGAGAYGGDRAAIGQAELARQQSLADGQTIAGLYQQGYGQALGQFNAVQGQRQQGAQVLAGLGQGYNTLAQDAGQQAQQYGSLGQLALGQAGSYGSLGQLQGTTGQAYGTLAGLSGNLGSTAQANLISGASAGLQGATLRQQNDQQQDTAAYNQYMAGLSYPYQNVGFLSNIVQGIGSQEGNTATTQGNALSSIAGLGTSTIGILGATGGFGANGYLSGLGSTLSSFSDVRVKENIAPIGTTHDGQNLYRYNYKGSDPRDVKIGLMAQDVEQRDPGAVGDVGGIKTVNYDRATRGAAMMGLGARPTDPRPQRAAGGPVGLGMSPMGGPTMPGPVLLGLGARPRFDDGGAAIPSGGISFNGVPGGGAAGLGAGGLNTNPGSLTAGMATAHAGLGAGAGRPSQAPQPAGLGVMSAAPAVSFNGAGQAGLGDVSFSGGSSSGAGLGAAPSTQDPSSPGFSPAAASGADSGQAGLGANPSGGLSQNAWLAIAAAGAGMAAGSSMSFGANVGQGLMSGLKTYEGLQQQDRQNAYQQRTLAQTDRQIDLKVQEMHDATARAQQQLSIESANAATQAQNANTTASATASENATRDQARQIGRFSTGYSPGIGYVTRDLMNPTAPPVVTPYDPTAPAGQGASTGQGTAAPAAAAPPVSFNDPPPGGSSPPAMPPVASAPPPQGGVSASGGAPAPGATSFTSPMPGSAPTVPSGFSGASAGAPQAGAPTGRPVQGAAPPSSGAVPVGASWSPTLAPTPGFISPNQFGISQNPELAKQQNDIGAKAVQEARESSMKASAGQAQLSSMQGAMAALPKTGLLSPGQFGDERATIAKTLNGVAQTLGADPVFDPNTIANTELMKKEAFRLGTAMIADTNGGREAGFILQNSVSATPSLNNSPIGFQRLAAGIQQANQYKIDRSTFLDAYYGKFGNLDGALPEFNRLNPPQAYVNRAIVSTIPSDYVQRLQQVARSNPGAASAFDQRFGVGASSAVLGQ